jgi:hypothetical protein
MSPHRFGVTAVRCGKFGALVLIEPAIIRSAGYWSSLQARIGERDALQMRGVYSACWSSSLPFAPYRAL